MIRKQKVGLAGAWLIACFCLPCIPGSAQNDPYTDAFNAGAIGEDPAVRPAQQASAPLPSQPNLHGALVPRPSTNHRVLNEAPTPPESLQSQPASQGSNAAGPGTNNSDKKNDAPSASDSAATASHPSADSGPTDQPPSSELQRSPDGARGATASSKGNSSSKAGSVPGSDEFSSGASGTQFRSNPVTGSQTESIDQSQAPTLQGATNGTIGPQAGDATVIEGVNTAGTVRVNNLANLEALLNVMANGLEILGIAWGGPTMIMGFLHMGHSVSVGLKRALWGAVGVTGGVAMPTCINWLVASARDANLFS